MVESRKRRGYLVVVEGRKRRGYLVVVESCKTSLGLGCSLRLVHIETAPSTRVGVMEMSGDQSGFHSCHSLSERSWDQSGSHSCHSLVERSWDQSGSHSFQSQ